MTVLPPYLQPGDMIGIVCPAGFMQPAKAEACIKKFQEWGYRVLTGKTVSAEEPVNYFSGTDEERLSDLQEMLDNPDVKAILCARGGYGTSRIIDRLNFSVFRKSPKWIIGYSDITVLLSHVYRNFSIASLHSPMAGAFNQYDDSAEYLLSLRNALEGKKIRYTCPVNGRNRKGQGVGELVGGNLSLITHLLGSSSEIKTKNRILFIEEIDEYLYKTDRMMLQLKRAGKLDKLAGLIVGGFTDMKDTTIPFGKEIREIIFEHVQEFDYPVCFDFPVGHQPENYALKFGAGYKLKVSNSKVSLDE
jgi:muramoyltetrapeptide carboxypeptidase